MFFENLSIFSVFGDSYKSPEKGTKSVRFHMRRKQEALFKQLKTEGGVLHDETGFRSVDGPVSAAVGCRFLKIIIYWRFVKYPVCRARLPVLTDRVCCPACGIKLPQ